MNVRRFAPRLVCCALGIVPLASAHADTYSFTGNFAADNSSVELLVGTTITQSFTFSTSSYASGGFEPVLTLFNAAGNVVAYSNSGMGDISVTDSLAAGNYELFLTEYPVEAIGSLSDGFYFSDDPTATGDFCGVTGGMFLDAGNTSCSQLTSSYALSVTSTGASTVTSAVAATPEPSSLLLMLAPAAGLMEVVRRRRLA